MRTITFYSYKGGVGRSLLVANAAMHLSTLGKRVFALDLDLEAPGLHYKFELGENAPRSQSAAGVVDILSFFLESGSMPDSLAEFVRPVSVSPEAESIHIMRAGTAPHRDYWSKLSRIDWHALFYGKNPVGTLFFLELKERIAREFGPEFLLIDARTGITEMGGVATTILADTVVCLALSSYEHLDGLRAVMTGIRQTTSQIGRKHPIDIVPVISRMSVRKDAASEEKELEGVQSFLASPCDGSTHLDVGQVMALHAEPLLDSAEQLLVGGKNSPHELPLLRDYLMLFSKVIPAEHIRPHVGQLIRRATSRLLDDPDAAQSDLEALTAYCADQEAYRALLKLYQLRNAPLEKILATASLMWQLGGSGSGPDQFLFEIVRTAFAETRAVDIQKKYADFGEAIWRSTGLKDIRLGMNVVNAYLPERRTRAERLLSDYIDKVDSPDPAAIVRLISLLAAKTPDRAMDVVQRFKGSEPSADFQIAWAKVVVDQRDTTMAMRLLEDPAFRIEAVRSEDLATAYRLSRLAGTEIQPSFLSDATELALGRQDIRRLRDIGDVMLEEGRFDEFKSALKGRIPPHLLEEIFETVGRRARRSRPFERVPI